MLRPHKTLLVELWILSFTCLMSGVSCCVGSEPAVVPKICVPYIQEVGDEVGNARRLGFLLSDLIGKDNSFNFIRSIVANYKRQLHTDRICGEGEEDNFDEKTDRYRISNNINTVVWGRDDIVSLLSLFFADDGCYLRPKICKKRQPLQRVLEILNAALILVDPFTDTPEMGQFRANSFELLSTADSSSFGDVRRPEDIPGCTMTSLRAILDLYTGMDHWVMTVPGREYSAAHQDGVLNVYKSASAASSTALSVLLHLVRLCGITELNMRSCRIVKPIDAAAVDILAQCKITRLVPPLDIQSCKHLHLTADSDTAIQDRIWNGVSQISMFSSGRDILHDHEVDDVFISPTAIFCRGLVREAVKPSDFAVLEHLEICDKFPVDKLEYLEQAVNLQVLKIEGCQNMPSLEFLRKMPRLRVLVLRNVGLTVLPGDILACLPELLGLCVSDNQLSKLPDAFGYLKKLRVFQAGGNRQLKTISDSITACHDLTNLILPNCLLASLPKKLACLRNLKYLNISRNKNSKLLSAVSNCTSLQHLVATNNRIIQLPSEICNLVNLRILDLRRNKLTDLPSGIGNMSALEELCLSNNQLRSLPSSMEKLPRLHSLYLEQNRFERVPQFVVYMRIVGSLFRIMLTDNNLHKSDRGDQVGHRTLWATFGTFFLSEVDHLKSLYKGEKERVYRDTRWERTYWDIQRITYLRHAAPPLSKLSVVAFRDIWDVILKDERLRPAVEPIGRDRFSESIDALYGLPLNRPDECAVDDSEKAIVRGYLEAISLNLRGRIRYSNDEELIVTAQSILSQLRDLFTKPPADQMDALRDIHSQYCLDRDPKDITVFVEEFLIRKKEEAFVNIVKSQDSSLVQLWRMIFSKELGIRTDPTDLRGRPVDGITYDTTPALLLRSFFMELDPKRIVHELMGEINSKGTAASAFDYLSSRTIIPRHFIAKHFELNTNSCSPLFGSPVGINKSGVKKVLMAMNLLRRNYLQLLIEMTPGYSFHYE